MKLKHACSLKKNCDQPRQHIKKQRCDFANKGPSSQSSGFSSTHVWTWELDYKESWAPKNWCFWGLFWRLLRVPWTARRSNQSILKEISPECSLEGLMLKLETPICWAPDVKEWLTGKDLDAGKDWRQEEKGKTEDEMIGWHHRLNGHEFGQALGIGDGHGSLVCCSPWGHKVLDTTEWLCWTEHNSILLKKLIYKRSSSNMLDYTLERFSYYIIMASWVKYRHSG